MKSREPIVAFASHDANRFVTPLALANMLFAGLIVLDGVLEANPTISLFGVLNFIHTFIFNRLTQNSLYFRERYGWLYAITTGIGLGLMNYILPDHLSELFHIIGVISILAVTVNSDQLRATTTLMLALFITLPANFQNLTQIESVLDYLMPFITSIVAMSMYLRIKRTTQQHIIRLETINQVSRQLMQSLDKDQVLTLLDATIQGTLEADTYFIGLVHGNNIRFDLFYDDDEYFNGTEVPLDGTLSNWVIKNQKELFLPDLREDVHLDGVDIRIIGKEKTNLSWIGVPLKAANITGIMVMASYQANSFDLADLELLSSLAQHVTLALDNTIRHAQVEEQARLDSLTGVYNHGYFLKKLSDQADDALLTKSPLSLIMLDIDYFKQYNDTYGHLVGDRILNTLCTAIKQHIKHVDAVGRWGGEEFIILLSNATGEQALQVAKRISETLADLRVEDRDQKTVPVPTISQGIAVFPNEADDIYRLIDLADKRLYIAKERGRDQIEPDINHWSKIQIEKKRAD